MGRTKQYDRTELLDRAVEIFRVQGFNGTSTATLVEELGVNRKSMYAEFGSKQGLFEAALDRYSEKHLSGVIGPIEEPGAGADGIRKAFMNYASASGGWAHGRGCLLCNTAVERGPLDAASGRRVAAYFERIEQGFRSCLETAQSDGDVSESADLDELAAFFTTALVGVAASIRGEAPPEQVRAACRVAVGVLDSVRPH